jgi:lantibiotic modifying enzyme
VLVDAETLWHLSRDANAPAPLDALYETGFLPRSCRRSSWQYRSSILGKTIRGKHTSRIGTKALNAAQYEREIVEGFSRGWRCILGTKARRAAFVRYLRRLRAFPNRWIYRSTEDYDAIRRASIAAAALRSGFERDLLMARLCSGSGMPSAVILEEIDSLKRLDIPYFSRKTAGNTVIPSEKTVSVELVKAIRRAVRL